jgi:glycosyltransferase involved in cell wall biosynthesis
MSWSIALVTHRYPPQTGGVETHVNRLAEGLADCGHEVTVIAADAEGDGDRRQRHNGVDVRRVRSLAPDGAGHLAPGVATTLAVLDPDLVHAHNYHSFPMAISALSIAVRRASTPLVVTPHYHGSSGDDLRDRLLSLYAPVGRWALQRASAVIAVSEWERRKLRQDFDIDGRVIPNGLDIDRFRTATPESREQPYLLTVGRLVEYKGVQHVIRALTEPRLAAFDLVVAGSGPYRDRLEAIAREAGVADRVTFTGYVDEARLPGLYAGASVFFSLSTVEAYGMTVAESLAAGTPCVVRNAGALSDWVSRDGCRGVSEPTPDRLAKAVSQLRSAKPSTTGLQTWDKTVDDIRSVYESVLDTRSEKIDHEPERSGNKSL